MASLTEEPSTAESARAKLGRGLGVQCALIFQSAPRPFLPRACHPSLFAISWPWRLHF